MAVTTINIEEVTDNVVTTNNVVTGDGVFDKLMETVNTHIDAQFKLNRIKGSDYATVYLGAMQSVIAQSIQFALQKKSQAAQVDLITRQTKGFDDDAKQKLLKQTLDSWSVAYSVAKDANSIPDTIKVNSIDSVMKNAMDSLSISVTNDPIGES